MNCCLNVLDNTVKIPQVSKVERRLGLIGDKFCKMQLRITVF